MAGDIHQTAAAKINLALHVTGRRADGYHLLDTLVTFFETGDVLSGSLSECDRLTLEGRFSSVLRQEAETDNLVCRARDKLRALRLANGLLAPPVHLTLEKNLPVASGIGGGSADAAATLRVLEQLWGGGLDDEALEALGISLGADVPMCLKSLPLRAEGIGEALSPLPTMPVFAMVLVNPLEAVSTPLVFRHLQRRDSPALAAVPQSSHPADWLCYLRNLANDLEAPARLVCPAIAEVLKELQTSGAELARMSGSGATCFGLYPSLAEAERAALAIRVRQPEWYVAAGSTRSLQS
ncbi:4-(cytidine 5'-diphospho)-2-C-methyl-D-erythritol kinase [Allorhizobium sp. BGMRC 0089]|uniref:4-(cytidine 5'-diphospho)-2-C-methyl-D-erythritol kinase n=1 Tax=Allorhizobium sonneratiae TaxID=2934936 RepID=UPI002033638E|nr:4-(cytidine 5'-diphospho)-2-C-methyl-D-erythritol kinase [Allorhizobium sonneratiae]MCM2291296.1 4-(cytidine 5'-diphospho)-2-C-methyl-D-erythritol kinase [Allorhizobium sonneratiae]